jgi:tetratricopeptide (TPR) repeat protein
MARLAARFGITRYEADEHYHKAIESYQKGNLDQAILEMNEAIDLLPSRAEYLAARGLFLLEHGLKEEAESDFENALMHNPYELLANYGKGVLSYRRRQYLEAREYFMNAWAVNETRVETLYYLALAEHHLNHYQKALDWMQQAIAQFELRGEDDKDARRHKRDAERWIAEMERMLLQPPLIT